MMKFKLRPILAEIKALYAKPISAERFQEYLAKLQGGTKGDLALPISGFNPMAQNHILAKIDELEKLEAEKIMEKSIAEFNATSKAASNEECLVVLNIADDLKGGWTNYYTTDFDSKFKLSAFVDRSFCVPYFWTSEVFSKEIINARILEYMNRTFYWRYNSKPKTLQDHLEQEIEVASKANENYLNLEKAKVEEIEKYYLEHLDSEEYDRIFNFFYGDVGAESLGYKQYGINELTGYDYAKIISERRKTRSQ